MQLKGKPIFTSKTINVCVHCGTYPVAGLYCPDCKTSKQRKEVDTIQLRDFGFKMCKYKAVEKYV